MKKWVQCLRVMALIAWIGTHCAEEQKPKFSVHLIIANYNENVEWTDQVTAIPKENIFVYQKNSPKKERYLQNTGNECHAYLRHIVTHYDSLPDYCIFVQGSPMDHCKNYLDYLNNAPVYATKKDFAQQKPKDLLFITNMYQNHTRETLTKHIPEIYQYYQRWLNKNIPPWGTSFWSNAQFQVSRHLIQARPVQYYQNMLKELVTPDRIHGDAHGIYVCGYLEQMWHQIFGYPELTDIHNTAYVNGEEKPMCGRKPLTVYNTEKS